MSPAGDDTLADDNRKTGILYVVSTPIGNLKDITFRAVELLKSVDLIAAEDTRKTSILTRTYDITAPRISFYEHNSRRRAPELVKKLHDGLNIALVSDAGTPGISDPGFLLIRQCIKEKIPVVPVPGATAFLTALIVSGLPADRFVFEGFLPVKKGRKRRLEYIAREDRTVLLYESPYRIRRTLEDLCAFCGNRTIAIARELTKLHEEVLRTTLSEACEIFRTKKPIGEYVLVIHGLENVASK